MTPIAHHLTFDLRNRANIARTAHEWDRLTRLLWRVLEPWQNLGFCVVHDHLHVVVAVDRPTAGRVAQAVECAIGWIRRPHDAPRRERWGPPRITPVRDRRHLEDTARYVLENGIVATGCDPLAWRWSSTWEILGLRRKPFALAKGFEVTSASFAASFLVGSQAWRPAPAGKTAVPRETPAVLWRFACASLGFGASSPAMNQHERAEARRMFVGLAGHRGWDSSGGASIGIPSRTWRRLANALPTPEELAPALRLISLLEGGYPLEELLPEQPADPLPKDARRRRPLARVARRASETR